MNSNQAGTGVTHHKVMKKNKRIEIPEVEGITIGEAYSQYVGVFRNGHVAYCTYKGKNFIAQYRHSDASTKTLKNGKVKEYPEWTRIYILKEGQKAVCGILMPLSLPLDTPMTEVEQYL